MRNYAFEIFRIPYFAEACFWKNSYFRKIRISVLENFSVPQFAEMCFGRKMPFRKIRKGKIGFLGIKENELYAIGFFFIIISFARKTVNIRMLFWSQQNQILWTTIIAVVVDVMDMIFIIFFFS